MPIQFSLQYLYLYIPTLEEYIFPHAMILMHLFVSFTLMSSIKKKMKSLPTPTEKGHGFM